MITRLRIYWTEVQKRRVAADVLPASSWGTRLELYNTGPTRLDEDEMKMLVFISEWKLCSNTGSDEAV